MPGLVLSRRQALAGLGSLIFASSARAAIAASAPFTQGVASGDPATDGFVLWTRLAPDPLAADGLGGMTGPVTVRWTVFSDDALQKPVLSGQAETHPDTAHTVHAEVRGLKPDRPYWYRFEALGAQSRTGRARTLPAATARPEKLSIAYASCANYEQGYFSAYRHMATENPDFVLYLGDYIYETSAKPDKAVVRRHDQAGPLRTLGAYRNRYALHHLDLDLQDLRAATTALMTWDDHEVQNDYGGFLSQWMRDDANMPTLRRAAYQAYYEAMPLRRVSRPADGHARLYKGYRFGTLAEINMLDGRQYRSAAACPVGDARKGHVVTDACSDRLDPKRSMLGFEQEDWLYDRFAKSQATWNVLGQDLLVAAYLQKSKDKVPVIGHYTDAWDGYPATRDRLIDAMLATRLKNPVILSGDLHSFWANEIKPSPDAPTVATEFLGTSVTSDNPDHALMTSTLSENPHVKYLNSRTQGYATAAFARDHAEVRFMAISDRADPQATVAVEKRFVVENGRPAIVAEG
jgi:alkaline phosphatase D